MKLDHVVNIADLRTMAKRRLPSAVFDLLDGAAGDEVTERSNRSSFSSIEFRPRPFVDVSKRDLSTLVFGQRISMPVMLAPTGAGRVAHRSAELAVAEAASAADTIYMQSTVTGFPLEDVAAAASRPLWYQLYLPPDRSATVNMLKRVADSGYTGLSITIDTPIFGNRERDMHNRVTMPMKITPKLLAQGAVRPRWAMDFMRGNLSGSVPLLARMRPGKHMMSMTATSSQILATQWPVTLEDIEFVRSNWEGPLLVKGVIGTGVADRLASLGVDGVIVSNHGGRQLDGVPAAISVLPDIVDEADGRFDVFLDGGIRRGADVVKAVALGAKAVFIGRPYLYGLAAGGEAGVERALRIFYNEIDRTMALLGARTIDELDRSLIRGAQ